MLPMTCRYKITGSTVAVRQADWGVSTVSHVAGTLHHTGITTALIVLSIYGSFRKGSAVHANSTNIHGSSLRGHAIHAILSDHPHRVSDRMTPRMPPDEARTLPYSYKHLEEITKQHDWVLKQRT